MARGGCGGERGGVTAELAIGLCSVSVVLTLLLGAAGAVRTELQVADGARAGARAAAAGQDAAGVREVVSRVAGAGAVASVAGGGGWTTVTVSASTGLPGLGGWRASASATARTEGSDDDG